jgi:hypothetical protein
MPRKPRPPKKPSPRFFPAGEDAGLLDDDDGDSPEPLIEFGRRAATPQEEQRGKQTSQARRRRKRPT